MADTFGPFSDSVWSDAQWARFAPIWSTSGVIGTGQSSVSAGSLGWGVSGLNVSAAAGRAWIRGFGFERTGTAPLQAVAPNTNGTQSRRDRLVLRRDLAARTVETAVLIGTPAATPVVPSLTQNETGVWEIPLFNFLTPPASGTAITSVVDERGWVSPGGVAPQRWMRASRNTTTAGFPNDTWTAFSSDTNWSSTSDVYNLRGNGGTVNLPWAGWYELTGGIHFAQNGTGDRGVRFDPSAGVDLGYGAGTSVYLDLKRAATGNGTIVTGSTGPVFTSGTSQTVVLGGYQSSGGSLDVLVVWVSAKYLGPAN